MNPWLLALIVALAALTVWGAISPRGQWRVLAAWTRREPYASEPGPVSVGIHRGVAILASLVLVAAGGSLASKASGENGGPEQLGHVTVKWGSPEPRVVNRVFAPSSEVPIGLLDQPVLRYEAMDGYHRTPAYLFSLKPLKPVSERGYVGSDPRPGLSALDSAYLVVQVRADPECVPRVVVAIQGAESVAIGVFYGRPDKPNGGSNPFVADCRPVPTEADAVSTLIPIALDAELKDRVVTTLDGTAIDGVSQG